MKKQISILKFLEIQGTYNSKFQDSPRRCKVLAEREKGAFTPGGGYVTVWMNEPDARSLQPGDLFLASPDKNEKDFTFVGPFEPATPAAANGHANGHAATAPPPAATAKKVAPKRSSVAPPDSVKKKMIEYIDFSAQVYRHCFHAVSNALQDEGLKDPQIKDITTTIFIQTVRRFNL